MARCRLNVLDEWIGSRARAKKKEIKKNNIIYIHVLLWRRWRARVTRTPALCSVRVRECVCVLAPQSSVPLSSLFVFFLLLLPSLYLCRRDCHIDPTPSHHWSLHSNVGKKRSNRNNNDTIIIKKKKKIRSTRVDVISSPSSIIPPTLPTNRFRFYESDSHTREQNIIHSCTIWPVTFHITDFKCARVLLDYGNISNGR